VIQSLLQERAANTGQAVLIDDSTAKPEDAQSVDFGQINTPELYFGYGYARAPLGNEEGFQPEKVVTYAIDDDQELKPNIIYLSGDWLNREDSMELKSATGRIMLEYYAKSVNIVAGGQGTVYVSEDGRQLGSAKGTDVGEGGSFSIDGQRLYNLASHRAYTEHTLVIDVVGEGFQIYTFTFG
jgi:hypothetical protein